jgi:hypothetical protein
MSIARASVAGGASRRATRRDGAMPARRLCGAAAGRRKECGVPGARPAGFIDVVWHAA